MCKYEDFFFDKTILCSFKTGLQKYIHNCMIPGTVKRGAVDASRVRSAGRLICALK